MSENHSRTPRTNFFLGGDQRRKELEESLAQPECSCGDCICTDCADCGSPCQANCPGCAGYYSYIDADAASANRYEVTSATFDTRSAANYKKQASGGVLSTVGHGVRTAFLIFSA